MRIPRHIRFVVAVSSEGHGFDYHVGDRREVGPEIALPWALRFLREGTAVAASDARYVPAIRHTGGGMYELPDGSRVKGREAAEAELEALIARGFEPRPEGGDEEEGEADE